MVPTGPPGSQLAHLALRDGKADADELLKEDARFCAAVLEGKAYADRGEFIEEDEMGLRFEQMLQA